MSKALVAYFSITGVTENVARMLSEAIGADLFEVVPNPAVSGEENPGDITFAQTNVDCYDVIYVGLPIWWYAAPTVIHTFLSAYDLTGKTVIPFATSGGGGLDKVRPRLQESCSGADLREASLLSGDMTLQELEAWAKSF